MNPLMIDFDSEDELQDKQVPTQTKKIVKRQVSTPTKKIVKLKNGIPSKNYVH